VAPGLCRQRGLTSGVSGISPLHDGKITARQGRGGFRISSRMDTGVRDLVEPDGIEPTTSCLQSRRSPN
jgi:hypothetical protein